MTKRLCRANQWALLATIHSKAASRGGVSCTALRNRYSRIGLT